MRKLSLVEVKGELWSDRSFADIALIHVLKCDGRHPICSRCEGYGYACRWKDRNNRAMSLEGLSGDAAEDSGDVESLRRIISSYQNLLSSVRGKLDEEDRRRVDTALASPESLASLTPRSPQHSTTRSVELPAAPFRKSSTSVHRYLGDISDVSFFNSVKGLLQQDSSSYPRNDGALESYEREAAESTSAIGCSPTGTT